MFIIAQSDVSRVILQVRTKSKELSDKTVAGFVLATIYDGVWCTNFVIACELVGFNN